jgi:uncharacterized protein YacL
MLLQILRALFVLLMAGVGWFFVGHSGRPFGDLTWLGMMISVTIAVMFICIDILAPRKKLAVFSGLFLGLIVGITIAWGLAFAVNLMADQFLHQWGKEGYTEFRARHDAVIDFVNVVVGVVCCYLAVSFIFQTKDDFRFIIPYVEFRRQIRGARPMVVDTSVIIDGRLTALLETGILDTRLLIPRFVLHELQALADSADRLKRSRGRRGLEIVEELQAVKKAEVIIYEWPGNDHNELSTDERLLALAHDVSGRVLTNDYNLSKVAHVRGIDAVNLNDLASAVRPVALPGERMVVLLIKPGEGQGQGIGYLEDGTMVVVEQGRGRLNEEVEVTVTNSLQTNTGRMIFARLLDEGRANRSGSAAG